MNEICTRALAEQGLTPADVDANREGRLSATQLDRLGAVGKGGAVLVYGLVVPISVLSVGFAVYEYTQKHQPAVFVLPVVALAFCSLIYFVVYRANRLPLPSELGNAKVTCRRATVSASMIGSNRAVYNVWLGPMRYTGCASSLTDDVRKKGSIVDAYVVEERKLVVALVPAE